MGNRKSINQAQKELVKQIKSVDLKIVSRDTNFEKIKAHYLNPAKYDLSAKNESIRLRWHAIFTMKLNRMTDTEIVNILMKEGMGHAQAYNDIRNSCSLFGDVTNSNSTSKRVILESYALDLMNRCIEDGDTDNEIKALKLLLDISGVNDEVLQSFNPEKLKNNEVKLGISENTRMLIVKMANAGVIELNDLPAEDIEYAEVDE
jgi:hypothetical protein